MALSLHNAKGVQGIGDQAEVQYHTAGAAGVTAGDWVAISGPTVVAAHNGALPADAAAIGVALDTATVGQPVRVCTAGPCTAAVTAAIVAGSCLTTGGVAGQAIVWDNTAAGGDGGICGISLTVAAVGNTASVYVVRRLY